MCRLLILILAAGLLLAGCQQQTPLDLTALEGGARGGDAAAARQLVSLLGQQENDVNDKVYPMVIELGSVMAPYLLEKVESADRIEREHVIAALATLKVNDAVPAISRVLINPELKRRYVAAWALGELLDERGIPPLLTALSDSESEVRKFATRSLIKFGKRAVAPLIDYLPQAPALGAASAVRVLGDIGDNRAIPVLLAAEKGPARREIFLAFGKLRDPRAEEALIAGLKDDDWQVRMNAAMALGPLVSKKAVPALEVTLEDEIHAVREWSARSLEMITGHHLKYRNEKGEYVAPYSIYH
ncbi:MAG: hypothetical protein C0621_06330 [Desulfuromonas sp.]|nr:MAG: hypothetical protein C0621_06330 [Desulfuromonas sp.]